MMTRAPLEVQEKMVEEAFRAGQDTMSPLGWRTYLKKVYERAAYKAGVLTDDERIKLVEELGDVGGSWENVRGHLKENEGVLGGLEGVYSEIRELANGRLPGRGGMSGAELLRDFSTGTPGAPEIGPLLPNQHRMGSSAYVRSAFEPEGRFWQEQFPLVPNRESNVELIGGGGLNQAQARAKKFSRMSGMYVKAGVRDITRDRNFIGGKAARNKFNIAGTGEVSLTMNEYQVGGKGSRHFFQIPNAKEIKTNVGSVMLAAADHRGMGFSAVGKWTIQVKGKDGKLTRKVVDWNTGINTLVFGGEGLSSGSSLTERLHAAAGDAREQRRILDNFKTEVSALMYRVDGSQASMTQALFHSESAVPIELSAERIMDPNYRNTMDQVKNHWDEMVKSGHNIGPMSSATSMGERSRVSLRDWAGELDVFGANYPMERKFAGRFRGNYSLSPRAREAMETRPIMGKIPRSMPTTATSRFGEVVSNKTPNVFTYYSLKEMKDLRPEEAVLSRTVAPMVEFTEKKTYEVARGTTRAAIGEELSTNQSLGIDYRTGKEIRSAASEGHMTERILGAVDKGDLIELEVERTVPFQDGLKGYTRKVRYRIARESMTEELAHQFGINAQSPVYKYSHHIEAAMDVEALKKIPGEVYGQMASGLQYIAADKLKGVRSRRRGKGRGRTFGPKKGFQKYRNAHVKDMWNYVNNADLREKYLTRVAKEGESLARQFGLSENLLHHGAGLGLLKKAAGWNLSSSDIGLIGGFFHKQLFSALGGDMAASQKMGEIYRGIGLSTSDIKALMTSQGVIGGHALNIGDVDSLKVVERAGLDPRGLLEIKAQDWGQLGDDVIAEFARRIPDRGMGELITATKSMVGLAADIPEGTRGVENAAEAMELIGKENFVWKGGGRELYIPAAAGGHMGEYTQEVGERADMPLKKAYRQYIEARGRITDYEGMMSGTDYQDLPDYEALKVKATELEDALRNQLGHEMLGSTSLRGKIFGSLELTASTWTGSKASSHLSIEYGSIDELLNDHKNLFVSGITEKSYKRLHNDLMRVASEKEKTFLQDQYRRFMAGENIPTMEWRNPLIGPQSMTPGYIRRVEADAEGIYIKKMTLNKDGRAVDVSGMAAKSGDMDGDQISLMLMGDEKVAAEIDKTLHSASWRKDYVAALERKQDLEKAIAASAAGRDLGRANYEGLTRHVGVKMETGMISTLVDDMKATAAFNASSKEEYTIMSEIFARMSQAPISSKHGLYASEVSDLLDEFVSKDKGRVSGALEDVWDILMGEGKVEGYNKEEVISKVKGWVQTSSNNGELSAHRAVWRAANKAAKGGIAGEVSEDALVHIIKMMESGKGDLNAALVREMRMGPGSGISASRATVEAASNLGGMAINAFKKHWKYPAMGAAVGLGIAALGAGTSIAMPREDASMKATELMASRGPAELQMPSGIQNRILTSGGGGMQAGYRMSYSGDLNSSGMNDLAGFGAGVGGRVTVRDNRGAISPQYIDKAQDERYI
jgi:hypothetical protein